MINPLLVKLLGDDYPDVQSAAFITSNNFVKHGKLPVNCIATRLMQM